MSVSEINYLLKEAMGVVMIVCLPLLGLSLFVGLAISIFQAVTSIQEMTLTFVPKILISFLSIIIFGPWIIKVLVSYSEGLIRNIPSLIR